MSSKLLILIGVIVVVLLGLFGYKQFIHNDIPAPTAPTPKKVQPAPLTQEQQTGAYTEPIANKFVFQTESIEGQKLEVALDSVNVAGLNKAASTVVYGVTLSDPTNGKWRAKGFSLFNRTDGKIYPVVVKEVSRQAQGVRKISVIFTKVPSSLLLDNQIVFQVNPPTDASDVVLLLSVPERAQPPENVATETPAIVDPAKTPAKTPAKAPAKTPAKAPAKTTGPKAVVKKTAVKNTTARTTTKKAG